MTVSIGSVVLDDSLQIPDFFSQTSVAGNIRPTIGGVVTQRLAMSGGMKFTLTSAQGNAGLLGHFTGAQIASLMAIRDAGDPVTFVHPLGTWSVLIPLDGIRVDKLFDFQYPESAAAWFSGTITLITVS